MLLEELIELADEELFNHINLIKDFELNEDNETEATQDQPCQN